MTTDSVPVGELAGSSDALMRRGELEREPNNHRWDMIRAELFDTIRAQPEARPKKPCGFCGTPTRALSGVCTAHRDLPRLDPHTNIQAGGYDRSNHV